MNSATNLYAPDAAIERSSQKHKGDRLQRSRIYRQYLRRIMLCDVCENSARDRANEIIELCQVVPALAVKFVSWWFVVAHKSNTRMTPNEKS